MATDSGGLLFGPHDASGLQVAAGLNHGGIQALVPIDAPPRQPGSHGSNVKGRHGVWQAGPRTRPVSGAFRPRSFPEPWLEMLRSTIAAASWRLPFRAPRFL